MKIAQMLESSHHPWTAFRPGDDTFVVENAIGERIVETDTSAISIDTSEFIASASYMSLALALLTEGIAHLERDNGATWFCFEGQRYRSDNDWTSLILTIGWDKCMRALDEDGFDDRSTRYKTR